MSIDAVENKINYVDVGARGDLGEPWRNIEERLNIFGFEADPAEFKKLKAQFPTRTYFPIGLASTEEDFNLYVTKNPEQSSLYPSCENNNIFEKRHWVGRELDKVISVNCSTLDTVFSSQKVDAIKIDTQGAEYQILEGGKKILVRDLPILFLETWTYPVYTGAPLMHEVLSLLYSLGYELWATSQAAAWRYDTKILPQHLTSRIPQRLIGLNLLMVPNLNKMLTNLSKKQLIARIEILCIYRFFDSALLIAQKLEDEHFIGLIKNKIKIEHSKITRIKRIVKKLVTGLSSYPPIT